MNTQNHIIKPPTNMASNVQPPLPSNVQPPLPSNVQPPLPSNVQPPLPSNVQPPLPSNVQSNDICAICQDVLQLADMRELNCQHKFHKLCIQHWIEIRNLCPLCKCVADDKQPVKDLFDGNEHDDLTNQLIESLLAGSFRQVWRGFDNTTAHRAHQFGQNLIHFFMPSLSDQYQQLYETILIDENQFDYVLQPTQPTRPIQPTQPTRPIQPTQPTRPIQPTQPTRPIQPAQPTGPTQPTQPTRPIQPAQPTRPTQPTQPTRPIQSTQRHIKQVRSNVPVLSSEERQLRHQQDEILLPHENECPELAQCTNCFLISCRHKIKRCSMCKQIRYCSKKCQTQDWENHKDWCVQHRY